MKIVFKMLNIRTSNCREGTVGGLTSFVPVDDVREGDQMRAEMTSLFIGTNDVTPRSVLSLTIRGPKSPGIPSADACKTCFGGEF